MNKELFNTLYRLTKIKALNNSNWLNNSIKFDQLFTLGDTLLDGVFIGIDSNLYFSCTKYQGTSDEIVVHIPATSQGLSERTYTTEQEANEVILKIITYLQYKLAGIPNPNKEEQENEKQATTLLLFGNSFLNREIPIGVHTSLKEQPKEILQDIAHQIRLDPTYDDKFDNLESLLDYLVESKKNLTNYQNITKAILYRRYDNNPETSIMYYISRVIPNPKQEHICNI